MGLIENVKTYTGRDLETIFFRPMFSGKNAEELGIRILYNMPTPTTIQLWSPQSNVLKPYAAGWEGGSVADRKQKTIELSKIKAEVGFTAADYFQQVYELIVGRADVNLDDLTGTELEQAETELFRAAIAESLRVTMWIGKKSANTYNMFDGFLSKLFEYNAGYRPYLCKKAFICSISYFAAIPIRRKVSRFFGIEPLHHLSTVTRLTPQSSANLVLLYPFSSIISFTL